MIISSRTPEGDRNRCPVCGHKCKIVPACTASRDAPCPSCGHLLWFEDKETRSVTPRVKQKVLDNSPPQPLVRRPQGTPPAREPAVQAARLITRLLRRGVEKFGEPSAQQRQAFAEIQEPYVAERLLSLLHEARSWYALVAAWNAEQSSSKS